MTFCTIVGHASFHTAGTIGAFDDRTIEFLRGCPRNVRHRGTRMSQRR